MRKPLKAMLYYESLTSFKLNFLLILLVPAISVVLVNYFLNSSLPSEFYLKPQSQQDLLTIKNLDISLFNYYIRDQDDQIMSKYAQQINQTLLDNIYNKFVENYSVNIQYQEVTNQLYLELYGVVDLINKNPQEKQYYLAKYNLTEQLYQEINQQFKPSLFSIIFTRDTTQFIYNQTAFDRLIQQKSFDILSFSKYYNNPFKNVFYKMFVESQQDLTIIINPLPNKQNSYNSFTNIGRASLQLSYIVLLATVQYYTSRDRGKEHLVLRQASLNEYIYWIVRLLSSFIFSFVSIAILFLFSKQLELAKVDSLNLSQLFISALIISLQISAGSLLLSSVFGGKSVILPLIISIFIGIIMNFVLEVVIYNIMASKSIYDPSVVNQIFQVFISIVIHSSGMFFIIDKAYFLDSQIILCHQQYDINNLCYYSIPAFETIITISIGKFVIYTILSILLAYIKKEQCWTGRVFPRIQRKIIPNNNVDIQNISYSVKSNVILNDISIFYQNNFQTSLIGLSGSGKTTLLRILSGQLKAQNFNGTIYGFNLQKYNHIYKYRRHISYCPQDNSNIFLGLTIIQNFTIYGLIKGDIQNSQLLDLNSQLKQKVSTLSGGQQRRVSLLNALQGNNQLMLLDEITSGLDPLTCNLVDDLLQNINNSFIISTHDMLQVQKLTKQFLVIKNKSSQQLQLDEILLETQTKLTLRVFSGQQNQGQIIDFMHQNSTVLYQFQTKNFVQFNLQQDENLLETFKQLDNFKNNNIINNYSLIKFDTTQVLEGLIQNNLQENFQNQIENCTLKQQNKFILLLKFVLFNESKANQGPFYLLFPLILLVSLLSVYGIGYFSNSFINSSMQSQTDLIFADFYQQCQECCGGMSVESLITCKLNNNCFSSSQSNYLSPGPCYQLQLLMGFEIDQPKTRDMRQSIFPYYSGITNQNNILTNLIQPIQRQQSNIFIQSQQYQCIQFKEQCQFGCMQTTDPNECKDQCNIVAQQSIQACALNVSIPILKFIYSNESNSFVSNVIDTQTIISHGSNDIHNFGGSNYKQLQLSQQYPQFNRSSIIQNEQIIEIYSHSPFLIGQGGYYEQILSRNNLTQYTTGFQKNITPYDQNFIQETVIPISVIQEDFIIYKSQMNSFFAQEFSYSLGIAFQSEFIDDLGYEISLIQDNKQNIKTRIINNITSKAYENQPTRYKTTSFAIFSDQLLFVLLFLPFQFIGTKLAYDLSGFLENQQYQILFFHNISKQSFNNIYLLFRITTLIIPTLLISYLSYLANIIQKTHIFILFFSNLIVSLTSCFITLILLKFQFNQQNTTFISIIYVIITLFLQMFLFKSSFLQILLPTLLTQNLFQFESQSEAIVLNIATLTFILLLCYLLLNYNFHQTSSLIYPDYSFLNENQHCEISMSSVNVQINNKQIINDISLEIHKNQTVSLIGLSGSGKTTILRVLTAQQSYQGQISIQQKPLKYLNNFSFMPQFDIFFPALTIKDHIDFFSAVNSNKIQNLLAFLNLENHENKRIHQLSGGQKRRFSFVLMMLRKSDLIALDEITTGLSPDLRRQIWIIMGQVEGTVIVTSHDMEEVQAVSDVVYVVKNGQIVNVKKGFNQSVQAVRVWDGKDKGVVVVKGHDKSRLQWIYEQECVNQDLLRSQFMEWIQ